VIALIGPNGAGKTTLFNMISGVVKPDAGDIFIEGRRVTGVSAWRMAKMGVGRTFQNIRLFVDLTVLDNVALAGKGRLLSQVDPADIDPLLEKMQILEYRDQTAGALSYGVRRRVELARALAGRPKLILLDEPTAGMNPVESLQMLNIIKSLASEGLGLLLIEHNMRVAMQAAQRVVVMNLGQKLAEGSPQDIRSNKRVIEAYLGEA
jgi:ABC-type branched-subunit amino acid transport system ATPase component